MSGAVSLLKESGHFGLTAVWFPLVLWTLFALIVWGGLKLFNKAGVLYHYHLRVALMLGLPFSLIISGMAKYAIRVYGQSQAAATTSFIMVQNPVAVSAEPSTPGMLMILKDPYVWLGLLTLSFAVIAVFKLIKLTGSFRLLGKQFLHRSTFSIRELKKLDGENKKLARGLTREPMITLSDETGIPFTFGWKRPVIVIPSFLKERDDKLNLAIRHELMHIKRADYVLNSLVMLVKSLFWFHPLVHRFSSDINEYCELSCDREVLADREISRKEYAQLLFDLAPNSISCEQPVINMSVNQSSLKKRIAMMTHPTQNHPIRMSILLSLSLIVMIVGVISCSDVQDNGITNSDVARVQQNLDNGNTSDQPLYVINGEVMDLNQSRKTIARIKSKYIKSINVLKGKTAMEKYGDKGANGVVEMKLINKKKAFSDLKDEPTDIINQSKNKKPVFVVVENMPRLIGGLKSIQQKIKYPEMARKAGIEGRVYVQFIVGTDGKVENPQVIKGIGGGCDKEALRVVKQAKFKPGVQRGKPVPVQFSLPIVFKLDHGTEGEKSSVKTENPEMVDKKFVVRANFDNKKGTVTGTVYNNNKRPLAGANIVVKGTSIGTVTNENGKFSLNNIPDEKRKLVVSYVGYKTQTLTVVGYN